ncbi:MAG: hypothetical protein FJZ86_12985 [Chloroflexi bacterium]|nr:hypothetical protein [Chloroflexota bacterium]
MKNFFASIFLVLVLLAMTAGTAFAQETTPITGTVESVVLETDAITGETTIVVTLLDETTDTLQTVKLSLETAESLGLVVTDPTTGKSTVTEDAVGTTVEIDPATVLLEEETEEDQHPVGSALSDFFSGLLGVDYETIMTYHEDGVGLGVIAQALWLTNNIGGDTAAFEALLEAKQSGNYSAITLADGTTPDNWGDVVKSLKKGDNLGSVASGKGESAEDTSEVITEVPGKGLGNSNNGNGDGNSNSNGHGNGNDKDNGKDNGKGGGRP